MVRRVRLNRSKYFRLTQELTHYQAGHPREDVAVVGDDAAAAGARLRPAGRTWWSKCVKSQN